MMNATIKKYGICSLLTALVLFFLALKLGGDLSYSTQEVLGYTAMCLSLVFVFFGIKHYRDTENEGKIAFAKALKIGLLISLFAALGFGIIDFIYTTWVNPDFVVQYQETMLATMKAELPVAEYEAKSKELVKQMETFGSPIAMAFIMFVTVMIIGFIFSLISGLILQKK